jgi:hypothetical protein
MRCPCGSFGKEEGEGQSPASWLVGLVVMAAWSQLQALGPSSHATEATAITGSSKSKYYHQPYCLIQRQPLSCSELGLMS